jgi:hypothetical protein
MESAQAVRFTAFRDPGVTAVYSSQNLDTGNISNNQLLNANDDLMQDASISPVMAKEFKKLKDMISSVPGMMQPTPEISPTTQDLEIRSPYL